MANKTDRELARSKKAGNENVEDFGEWDTSVTDPPRGVSAVGVEDDVPTTTTPTVAAAAPVVYDEKDFDLMDNPTTSEVELEMEELDSTFGEGEGRRAPVLNRLDQETPPPPHRVTAAAIAPPLVAGFEIDTSQSYTTIGPSIVIRGKLKCDENLIVSGRLEADVKSTKDLRIESQGIMNANIDVHAVSISGIVVGDIRASELVELGSEARVVGDISTPRLIIHDGAKFRGVIEMDGLQSLELVKPAPPRAAEPPQRLEAPRPARVQVAEVMTSDTPAPPPTRGETAARSTVSPLEPMALKPQVKPARPAPVPVPVPAPVPATPAARAPAAAVSAATPASPKPTEKAAEPTDKGGGWFGRRS